MGIAEKVNKKWALMEERLEWLKVIRKYDNAQYGVEDYYGMKDYKDVTYDEAKKRFMEIMIKKGQ